MYSFCLANFTILFGEKKYFLKYEKEELASLKIFCVNYANKKNKYQINVNIKELKKEYNCKHVHSLD